MAHSIRNGMLLVGILSVLLAALGAVVLFHRAFAAEIDRDLARAARLVAAGYSAESDPAALAAYLVDDNLRLTLIAADGTVLYDSAAPAASLPNHAGRPEIAAALQTGSGSSVRASDTVGYDTHYCALRLADGAVLRLAAETGNLWASYNRVLPAMAGVCLLVAAAAYALAWRCTRRLVQPIIRMAENLDTIEANVPYVELVPLAHTVQSDRKLREDNETMRREFTANVSHELKTPLTSISGYAELIESGMAKPADVPTFGHRIHKEAKRMIALVSDIIQLSELEGMREETAPAAELADLDLAPLLRDIAATMTVNARRAYVTLQCDAAPATVHGSRDLLTELATNLCDNAIRYNRPGGHVSLSCGTGADGSAFLAVEDNGIGIPADAQSRVFERFYRVDKSRSKATGGTGLGLAIVKHIAVLHGARIDLHSTVGAGTTIRVTFPHA